MQTIKMGESTKVSAGDHALEQSAPVTVEAQNQTNDDNTHARLRALLRDAAGLCADPAPLALAHLADASSACDRAEFKEQVVGITALPPCGATVMTMRISVATPVWPEAASYRSRRRSTLGRPAPRAS